MNNNPQAVVAVKEELIDEVRLKKKTAVVIKICSNFFKFVVFVCKIEASV